MAHHSFTKHVKAPPELVWSILADQRGMSGWTRVRKSTLEREGDPAPNGVGAVRRLVTVGPPIREEITVFEPNKVLGYKLLSGVPASNYHGRTELKANGDGTDITWSVDYSPKFPGLQLVISFVISDLLGALVREAARRA
jgi:uncharacterized protein YndB with AHSA1/START domain